LSNCIQRYRSEIVTLDAGVEVKEVWFTLVHHLVHMQVAMDTSFVPTFKTIAVHRDVAKNQSVFVMATTNIIKVMTIVT
jgi:hypothetical protein